MNYFTPEELQCPCCKEFKMNVEFMIKLNKLRADLGFPFIITSGYRCEKHNKEIGGAKHSAHLTGNAVDIAVSHEKALDIVSEATSYGMNGVGVSQKGQGRFIHIDDKHESPTIWSY